MTFKYIKISPSSYLMDYEFCGMPIMRYSKVEIIVSDPAELDIVYSNSVNTKTIRIKADATRFTALKKIFTFAMRFEKLENLFIDDDYIRSHDVSTAYFMRRLKEERPGLNVVWTCAYKIDGQHGR